MKTLLSSLILSVSLTSSLYAQVIKDPNNLMGQIDKFVSGQDFSKAFKKGDSVTIENKECIIYNDGNGSYMECEGEEEEKSIIKATSAYALTNENLAILKTVYEANKRNPVRFYLEKNNKQLMAGLKANAFIAKSSNDGYIRLDSLTSTSYDLNGSHNALRLDISLVFIADDGSEVPFPMYLIVVQDLPFFGQIAEAGIEMEIDGIKLPPTMQVIEYQKN